MRTMHQVFHLFPYKIQILQLRLQANANKVEESVFVQTIIQRTDDHLGLLDFILFSNEANFHTYHHW